MLSESVTHENAPSPMAIHRRMFLRTIGGIVAFGDVIQHVITNVRLVGIGFMLAFMTVSIPWHYPISAQNSISDRVTRSEVQVVDIQKALDERDRADRARDQKIDGLTESVNNIRGYGGGMMVLLMILSAAAPFLDLFRRRNPR